MRDGRERPYPDGPHPSLRRLHLPDEPLMQWYPHLHLDKPSSILFSGRTQPFQKQQSSGLDKSQSPCSAQTTVHFPSLPLIPALALASLPLGPSFSFTQAQAPRLQAAFPESSAAHPANASMLPASGRTWGLGGRERRGF